MKIRRMEEGGYFQHLDHATESVNSWADWKKEIAGVTEKSRNVQPLTYSEGKKTASFNCSNNLKK